MSKKCWDFFNCPSRFGCVVYMKGIQKCWEVKEHKNRKDRISIMSGMTCSGVSCKGCAYYKMIHKKKGVTDA